MERKSILIAIGGGSGSGKTTLSDYLETIFKDDLVRVSYDTYCNDRSHLSPEERTKSNYDVPESYDAPLFSKHLKELLEGKSIQKPIYDFKTHSRIKETQLVEPKKIIIVEGIMIGVLTLVAFSIGNKYYGLEVGRTMAFLSIGFLELIHSFNIKNEKSIFETGLFENKYLVGSFVLGIFIQAIVVVIPALANVFEVVPLNLTQWIITVAISVLPVPVIELQKKLDAKNKDTENNKEEKKNYSFAKM